MAPITESNYFPSLDKCLQGGRYLIPWKTAFYAVLNKESTEVIEHFFSDPEVQHLLLRPFEAFPLPSPSTKLAFEAKTSAINVAPSPNARFDIKQLKEDTLWLSSEARIDEITALRVVVEEWQCSASTALLGPFSTQELRSIQEVADQNSSFLPATLISQSTDADGIQREFVKQESRRLRILRTYLSERHFLLKCVSYLLQNNIYPPDENSPDEQNKEAETALASMDKVGRNLVLALGESDIWLLSCIRAIGSNIEKIKNGSGWYKEIGGRNDVDVEWINTNISEATTAMEVMYQILDTSRDFPSSNTVLGWYDIAINTNFLHYASVSLKTC